MTAACTCGTCSLVDFRSYAVAELPLTPGVTTILGPNGHGKTNLVEAIGYVAALGQPPGGHRPAAGALRGRACRPAAAVVQHGRETLVELELNPGRSNRARLNRSPVSRPRDVLGTLRSVLFAPEDLGLVKGDPAGRQAFLDDLLVARQPRWAGVRADYERMLKQRNALLKSAAPVLRPGARRRPRPDEQPPESGAASALHTLDVWNTHLAQVGGQLLYGRLRLLRDLGPYLATAYDAVSAGPVGCKLPLLAARADGGRSPPARCRRCRSCTTSCWPRSTRCGGRRSSAGCPSSARTATSSPCSRAAAGQGLRQPRRVLVACARAAARRLPAAAARPR